MSRGKGTLFALVAIGAMMASPVVAATTSGAVAATDERAPEAVTDVTGFAGTDGVEITWALSASDFVRPSPTGSDFTSGGSFSNVNDVAGYNVYRDDELAGSVKAGETAFVDSNAIGSSIIYVVTAVDAAGNESDHSEEVIVSLGPAPVAVIGTPDGDYGIIDPDDFDTQTIDVENAATEDDANLTVTITVVGDGFSSSDDSIDLAPGEEGSVEITFDAEDVDNLNGTYVGTVTVKTTDPDNRKVVYDVTAEIVDGIGPTEIDVTPASVTFAATVIGNTRTTELTIANIGRPTLEGEVSISGDAEFTIDVDSYSLDTDGEEVVTVTFAPTASVTSTATITITSNDEGAPSTDVEVSGRGTAAPEGPGVVATEVSKVELTLDTALPTEQADIDALRDQIIAALSEALGIPISRFVGVTLTEGSVIVSFTITQTVTEEGEPTAAEAVATLQTVIADTATPNPITDIAPVTAIVDNSETVVLQPEDADGNPVLGWFTLGAFGNQVAVDDFFAFAGGFGKADGVDDDFAKFAKFDIAGPDGDSEPDGKVGIDDFFAFAENYGTVVANADEIIAALQ